MPSPLQENTKYLHFQSSLPYSDPISRGIKHKAQFHASYKLTFYPWSLSHQPEISQDQRGYPHKYTYQQATGIFFCRVLAIQMSTSPRVVALESKLLGICLISVPNRAVLPSEMGKKCFVKQWQSKTQNRHIQADGRLLFQFYRRTSSDWNSSRIQDCCWVQFDV